jgi:tetratricopeptide (TPR) repeat protein
MKLRYIFIPAAPLAIIPFWFLLRGPGEVEDERIPSGEPEKRTVETMGPVAAAEPSSSPPDVIIQPTSVRESSPEFRLRARPDTSTGKAKATALERNIPDTTGPAGVEKEKKPEGKPMVMGVVKENAKLDPKLAELAKEGVLAVTEERWDDARETYLELVRQAPNNALAYANLGVAEHQLGNLLAAAGNLRKSLDINPGIAQNWQTLGVIHFERGELEMAISTLTRAIHEDPSNARSRLYLATVIREYGWLDASITELERALETDPKLAEAHYNLAVTYLDENPPRLELAKRHYFSAINLGAKGSTELEEIFKKAANSEE